MTYESRLAWQRIFSADTRTKVITAVPDLKQTPPHSYRTTFEHNPQFKPLAGLKLITRFRYPIWEAKPITPPNKACFVIVLSSPS